MKQGLKMIFSELKSKWGIVLAGALGAAVTGLEVLFESEPVGLFEFVFDSIEKGLILTGAVGVYLLLKSSAQQQGEQLRLKQELDVARVEGHAWRERAQTFVNGVGEEIDKQFVDRNLSSAESEVGLLMIKGLSHKEIADLRGTAEATVRQQARSIYSKSGLPGKAAFSAYFLEDLLPPKNGANGAQQVNVG